ncbi:MAG: hypothetical protein K5981_10260 [Clostridia bacterium]|nr:hypothetical protein [Clostridia bacterium]
MKLEVRKAEPRDLPQIKRLIDDTISLDFYSVEDLEGMLSGEDDLLYVVADTDRDDAVASYFYAFLSTLDEALATLHVKEKPEALAKYAGNTRVGVYKTSSTDPAYRNHGVFSAFMSGLQPVLRERGAELIMNTALKPYGRDIPIKRILQDTGFVPAAAVYRPWAETKGYCPYCGQDYCICDAVLYIREFEGAK